MTWVKLDDAIWSHRKIRAAGLEATGLFACGIAWCNQNLTDGHIPRHILPMLGDLRRPEQLASKLVEVGLWHETDDGWEVHDFLDYQPSKEQVESQRASQRDRKRKSRKGSQRDDDETTAGSPDTPTRPDPTRNGSTYDNDHPLNGARSSSWTLDQLYIEGGQLLARCAGNVRNLDHYAAGAAGNLRREKRLLAERIHATGRYSLEEAAGLLTHPDADAVLDITEDFDFTPADEIEVSPS